MKAEARKYMRLHVNYVDSATTLAEQTATAMGNPEWLDDETHWVWDMAVSELEKADRQSDKYGVVPWRYSIK